MLRSRRDFAIIVIVVVCVSSPWVAQAGPPCPASQASEFAAAFTGLYEQLGSAMGTPIECAQEDRVTKDEYQQTTTGVAVYQRASDTTTFTNGQQFWRLSPGGLVQWEGWHGRGGPPIAIDGLAKTEDLTMSTAPAGDYPRVQSAILTQAPNVDHQHVVLERNGASYLVQVNEGCLDDRPTASRVVFVISKESFAEPASRLILQVGARECVITASQPL